MLGCVRWPCEVKFVEAGKPASTARSHRKPDMDPMRRRGQGRESRHGTAGTDSYSSRQSWLTSRTRTAHAPELICNGALLQTDSTTTVDDCDDPQILTIAKASLGRHAPCPLLGLSLEGLCQCDAPIRLPGRSSSRSTASPSRLVVASGTSKPALTAVLSVGKLAPPFANLPWGLPLPRTRSPIGDRHRTTDLSPHDLK